MDDERRYREDDVRRIFELAASTSEALQGSASSSEGFTLAELQAIGGEVGLSPDRIAAAASTLDATPAAPLRDMFGMPVSVQRTVGLPRLPDDNEWELLLVELRTTFAAHGKDGSRGNLREWRNGNLFAYVEPTQAGPRLRLGTLKRDAALVNALGVALSVAAVATFGTLAVTNDLGLPNAFLPVIWGASAAGAFGYNAVRLRRWAQERVIQMERVADRARRLLSEDPAVR